MSKKKKIKKTKNVEEDLDIVEEVTLSKKGNKKSDKVENLEEDKKKKKKVKPMKRKKTAYEKRKIFMKIAAWIMVAVMIIGVLMTFLIYFV